MVGSITGRHFGDDELAMLKGTYLDLGGELLGGQKLVATGRKVVTEEDLAIFLMLLRFFTSNMNADGSLPTARWIEMWTALHEAGDIGRPWCHHRYAAMRNYLSSKGLLSWEDAGYLIGGVGGDGRYVPGQAAKWHASEDVPAGDGVGDEVGLPAEEPRDLAEREVVVLHRMTSLSYL